MADCPPRASPSLGGRTNMTKRFMPITLFLWLAVFAASGVAQSKPATPAAAAEPLAPVAWLVGGTWVSDIKDPSDGTVTHVENRIRWAPNHQAIEFNTDFNGKPHYYGFYAYNPVTKTISFYYTNSNGEMTIGTESPDPRWQNSPPGVRHPARQWQDRARSLHGRARRKRRLLVHRLHAEGRSLDAGIQNSL